MIEGSGPLTHVGTFRMLGICGMYSYFPRVVCFENIEKGGGLWRMSKA